MSSSPRLAPASIHVIAPGDFSTSHGVPVPSAHGDVTDRLLVDGPPIDDSFGDHDAPLDSVRSPAICTTPCAPDLGLLREQKSVWANGSFVRRSAGDATRPIHQCSIRPHDTNGGPWKKKWSKTDHGKGSNRRFDHLVLLFYLGHLT